MEFIVARLSEILSAPVISVSARSSVQNAVEIMFQRQMGSVVVVDRGKVVGIFTERDLLSRVVAEGRQPRLTAVGEVMTQKPKTVRDSQSHEDALHLMYSGHFRHLPVVNERGEYIGMISQGDILRTYEKILFE